MLEIKNVYKTFNPGTVNQKVALNDLNLTLEDGDFVTVIGGNGAGKSTMKTWPWPPAAVRAAPCALVLPKRKMPSTTSCLKPWAWAWRTA